MEAKKLVVEDPFAAAESYFSEIVSDLRSTERLHVDLSSLENMLDEKGRELLRQLLQAHLDLRGQGHTDGPVIGSDGVERVERREDTSRGVLSLFGEVRATRERFDAPGSRGLAPLDAELNLPPEKASLAVQKRVADEAARGSYEEVVSAMAKTTGAPVAKRQAEEAVRRAAVDFDDFYQSSRAVKKGEDVSGTGSVLVLTSDGAGVVMRKEGLRPETKKKAEATQHKMSKRLSKGEKKNRKRRAMVAAVYTIAPFPRTPEDIVKDLNREVEDVAIKLKRPRPEKKRVWASLEKELQEVETEIFEEALARDPDLKKRWAVLLDGDEPQLDAFLETAAECGIELTAILDIIHVIERLWKAGSCFEKESTPELEKWVSDRLLRILRGEASQVAAGIRRSATRRGLSSKRRKEADNCADYLLYYKNFMRYDEYLRDGLPIATGVIEGACRHLVKDRMDITGARWGLEGGEAVLRLRSLRSSGDLDEYWTFHEAQEKKRNHLQHYANETVPPVDSTTGGKRKNGHLRALE